MLQDYPDTWCELAMLVILTHTIHGQFHFYLVIKEIAWLSGLRQCSGFNYQFQVILRSCTLKGNNSPHCKTLVRQKVSDFVETGDKKGNKNWLKSALKPSPAWNPDQDSSKLTEMKIYGGLSCFFWECKYWGTWSFCRPHLLVSHSYPILRATPVIHERNGLGENLPKPFGKSLLKFVITHN